jgi:hypothetical protein
MIIYRNKERGKEGEKGGKKEKKMEGRAAFTNFEFLI